MSMDARLPAVCASLERGVEAMLRAVYPDITETNHICDCSRASRPSGARAVLGGVIVETSLWNRPTGWKKQFVLDAAFFLAALPRLGRC